MTRALKAAKTKPVPPPIKVTKGTSSDTEVSSRTEREEVAARASAEEGSAASAKRASAKRPRLLKGGFCCSVMESLAQRHYSFAKWCANVLCLEL